MALQIYRSNCMERLADALARAVQRPLANVLAAECIAVPSAGMERWLALELASRLGVWANPAFPFPGKLVEAVLADVLQDEALEAPVFTVLGTQFAVAALLPELTQRPGFELVRGYLERDGGRSGRRLSLSARIAEVFDRYVTYRPELVREWQHGTEPDWQAELFRALCERLGPQHLAARADAALRALAAGARLSPRVPERIHVFGVSTLPPQYLQILSEVSSQREVNVFVLSPCREYYGDLRSARESSRARRRASQEAMAVELPSEGHALLSSLGRHSREFQELLESQPYSEPGAELYAEPGDDTLLHTLQSDMLSLRDRTATPALLAPGDDSLSIHACHGPMRELEVLHDQLLALISDHGVEPHQIIVLAPDIASYAPVIEAVFAPGLGRPRIPYRIADRSALSSFAVLRAFDALLSVFGSRFGASQVLDLLGQDLIRERFEIAMDEVEQLREWARDSGIRWGVDGEHRAEVGQPASTENTWRFGLSRLAIGYASGAPPEALFLGHAPAEVDSGDADLLGRFMQFCEQLFALRLELRQPADLPTWRERLGRVLAAFVIEKREIAAEHAALRSALLSLEQHAAQGGFSEEIDLASLRELLSGVLESRPALHGFLGGGVTFCQLVPMRSIPFDVVCCLGLNDGTFPANDSPLDFDLIAQKRRPGDRSRREDDRQLFLESILSARRKLILSYVGQSIHDGQPLLPSVLVTELIDHAARNFALPDAASDPQRAMEQRLVTRHPLSPVSPTYFAPGRDPRLFSYSTWALEGARALSRSRERVPPFYTGDPERVGQPPNEITLSELEQGLVYPLRTFARLKLGLTLGRDLAVLEDREPFDLDPLEKWQLGNDLLVQHLDQGNEALEHLASFERERARGRLPHGAPGQLEFRDLHAQVGTIAQSYVSEAGGARLPGCELTLQLLGTRLTGRLEQLWPQAQLRVQYSRTGGRHELLLFIRHVALCCQRERTPDAGLPERSVLIGRSGRDAELVELLPLEHPTRVLRDLLEIYAAGQTGPLPLFEQASREYAVQLEQGKPESQALASARAKFSSSYDDAFLDAKDAYVAQFFPDFDAALEVSGSYSFTELARRVYEPLLKCRRAT